ncbi:phytanoyl-CoA dioxygenase [Mycolicibacterium sp. CH28]|uniref:phytanoyl-CoA dioxygenase family protein n=1 Tax=Mycolicibacterium sp. CH28 TaxID=2512237 RepID=UPI001080B616|nr:phytanoyl-CoA dioxygenase family protein [Mycolicibacterium sp. CH28]TGD90613.1 phytanoyl-CoA dioxygenase [Mycolicibacterium sp. CH28]
MAEVRTHPSPWLTEPAFQLDDLHRLTERGTELDPYPHAAEVRDNVLVYAANDLVGADRRSVQGEIITALADGPGVIVVADAFSHAVVDAASAAFRSLITAQRRAGTAAGDHFGTADTHDRVWNAAQKLALHSPTTYADYYANDTLALVCQAWLGPRYQVTSQVNVVNPGAAGQVPHRDYHLGFVAPDQLTDYPAHVHRLSATLTLQGAVAHTDMPLESGPTMLLPYSHLFEGGYVAFHRPEFVDYFSTHHVQIPLRKGDAVFFNPALFHGAGSNTSADVRRMANLLQISSPFGRAMEALDHVAMVRAVYPALCAMKAAGRPQADLLNAVVATADGYPFPTNLDRDQPIGSLAPHTQVDLVLAALADGLTPDALDVALGDHNERRIP